MEPAPSPRARLAGAGSIWSVLIGGEVPPFQGASRRGMPGRACKYELRDYRLATPSIKFPLTPQSDLLDSHSAN